MAKNEQSAIITGGAHRIGRAIAFALAQKGFNIALHYNSSEVDAVAAMEEIKKLGRQCIILSCDLSSSDELALLIQNAQKQLPGLNLLINNASIFDREEFKETSVSLFNKNFDIHVRAPYFLSLEFAKSCKSGQIINIVDALVTHSSTDYFAYMLSKKALYEFTMMAAKALAPEIRVNAIAPGTITQPINSDDPKYMDKRAEQLPLKMKGDLQYIIQGINYLLDNPYVTGECLFVDGGIHLAK